MRQLLIIIILITSASFFFTCKKESNPLYLTESAQLSLQVDGEPYCTEVYLQLKAEGIKFPGKVQLVRDSVMIFSHQFDKTGTLLDTLLLDSALLPGTSYHYEARLLLPEGDEVQSRELSVRTMDTTSHNFTWEIIEFGGGGGSSDLYDVAIIDENNIWAVGEIHTPETDRWNEDSTEWIPPYNAVHWDGEKWELKRINYKGIPWPIRSVLAISENEIWFDAFVKWNGMDFVELTIPNILIGQSINEMWGTSGDDIYLVGNNGFIAHYNGSRWEKIESGTDLPINDIWGIEQLNDEPFVIAVASELFGPGERKILQINPQKEITEIEWPHQDKKLFSTWFKNSHRIYVAGTDLFTLTGLKEIRFIEGLPYYFKERIRGTDYNDLFICGHYGLLGHYNGISWRIYDVQGSIFHSIEGKQNLAVAVGTILSHGIIAITQR